MICSRCKTPMGEEKRSFHKRRKWICPKCKKVVMQNSMRISKKSLGRGILPRLILTA